MQQLVALSPNFVRLPDWQQLMALLPKFVRLPDYQVYLCDDDGKDPGKSSVAHNAINFGLLLTIAHTFVNCFRFVKWVLELFADYFVVSQAFGLEPQAPPPTQEAPFASAPPAAQAHLAAPAQVPAGSFLYHRHCKAQVYSLDFSNPDKDVHLDPNCFQAKRHRPIAQARSVCSSCGPKKTQ